MPKRCLVSAAIVVALKAAPLLPPIPLGLQVLDSIGAEGGSRTLTTLWVTGF
jgi:hypothetical protein